MPGTVADETGHDAAPIDLNWRTSLSRSISDRFELLAGLRLKPEIAAANAAFPLRVPRSFAALMVPGDPDDPLLRQVLPIAEESRTTDGCSSDPVGDLISQIAPGVLHKYSGRALLIVTGACAIHCRYCFRRAYQYAENSISGRDFQAAIDALDADRTIEEVILSGGDPLTVSNQKLKKVFDALTQISHIKRIRIHSRIPIVLPERIDLQLLDLIAACPLPVVIVIHSNHAREISERAAVAVAELIQAGATLLNQSVLLRGVNDAVNSLTELSERLFEIGVLPYYLHQLDPVAGAAHFNVEDARAIELIDAVAERLPGYLVPKLVREIPGESAKRLVYGRAKK